MVKYLIILLAGAFSAQAFDYLVYNTNSVPVPFQPVGKVERSVSVLPARPPNHGVLIYSGTSATSNWNGAVPNLALNWCKVSNNTVVPITQSESNSIITAQINSVSNAVAQAQIAAKAESTNGLVNYFNTPEGRLQFAFMEATMDALNTIRGGLAGNTNMPLLTLTQLTNAIKVRIAAQANTQ